MLSLSNKDAAVCSTLMIASVMFPSFSDALVVPVVASLLTGIHIELPGSVWTARWPDGNHHCAIP